MVIEATLAAKECHGICGYSWAIAWAEAVVIGTISTLEEVASVVAEAVLAASVAEALAVEELAEAGKSSLIGHNKL